MFANPTVLQQGQGRFADPIYTLKKLIEHIDIEHIDSDSERLVFLYSSLVDCQEDFGDLESALASLNAAIEIVKLDDAALWFRRASLHRKRGEFEAAVSDYARAIQLDPKNVSADFERELLALVMPADKAGTPDIGESDNSFELLFARALTQDLRGRRRFKDGNRHAAAIAFMAAIADYTRLMDHSPFPYSLKVLLRDRRGQLLLSVDAPGKALTDFSALLKIDSKRADYYLHRAQAKLDLKFYDDALNDLSKAIDLAPRNSKIYLVSHERSAYISLIYGHNQDAISHLRKAGETPQLKLQLALAYYLNKDYVEAISELNRVEAAVDTLDATARAGLLRKLKLVKTRLPTLKEETQADIEQKRNQFLKVVEQGVEHGVAALKHFDLKELCEVGFAVIFKRLAPEADAVI